MNYFPKNQDCKYYSIIPLIILPLIDNDTISLKLFETNRKFWTENNCFNLNIDIPVASYLAVWQLANCMVNDLVEEKLGYEKDNLKLIYNLKTDVQIDSLDLVEIALYLEKNTAILIYENINFELLTDLVDYVFLVLSKRLKKSTCIWSKENIDILSYW